MKERPILFSGPMVRAILDGRKTQTRRPIKPQPVLTGFPGPHWPEHARKPWMPIGGVHQDRWPCPLGQPGDRLWVRETWGLMAHTDPTDWHRGSVAGASPDAIVPTYGVEHRANWRVENENAFWRPSIHMPRWASRITLEIVRVSVERVQDITEEGARAEGVKIGEDRSHSFAEHGLPYRPHADAFGDLWQSIYGTWADNPWVWAVEFRRVKP